VVSWFARNALGIVDLSTIKTGSSDRIFDYVQLLVIAIVAALGTIVWSILDRRRTAYPRLAAGAWVVLRYYLAASMLFYGFGKILKLQFPDLTPGWLDRRVGEMPPMALLWTFMGYSTPYTVFAGLAEMLGGMLLLWQRTATLGALIIVGAMSNVVMLNFSYDVSAKLYSIQLLIIALAIALPSLRRLIAAVLGRATAGAPSRGQLSPRAEQVRRIGKFAVVGTMLCNLCLTSRDEVKEMAHVHELYGTWLVDSFVIDGVEHPPLTPDPERWRAISANRFRLWISPMSGGHEGGGLEVDAVNRKIILALDDQGNGVTSPMENWDYALTGADTLVIDGVHRGKRLHVTLHPQPPPLLVTRGFHWVNERPFMQ
jgi:uncharacterized membrane protein YphA (DoxX/SURF4 family)